VRGEGAEVGEASHDLYVDTSAETTAQKRYRVAVSVEPNRRRACRHAAVMRGDTRVWGEGKGAGLGQVEWGGTALARLAAWAGEGGWEHDAHRSNAEGLRSVARSAEGAGRGAGESQGAAAGRQRRSAVACCTRLDGSKSRTHRRAASERAGGADDTAALCRPGGVGPDSCALAMCPVLEAS
jgi:hypothetical protein